MKLSSAAMPPTSKLKRQPSSAGFASRSLLLLVGAIALVVLAVFLLRPATAPTATKGPLPIRVAFAPIVLNLPSYVAQDRHLFASQGVKPVYTAFTSANEMINALVAGQVDAVTGVSLVPILNLEAQRPGSVHVVIHSVMTNDGPYDGLVVKADSPIQDLQGLPGRKVGLYPGTTALNLMKALLKKHQIQPEKVEFIQLPPASHLSALESGAIDALLAYEPTLSIALTQGNRRVFGSIYVDLQNPSPISATVISRDFEKKHPEAARAFVAGLDQSVASIRRDPQSARPSLANHTKLSTEVIPKVNLVADTLSTETNAASLQTFINFLVEIGELPKPVSAEALLRAQ